MYPVKAHKAIASAKSIKMWDLVWFVNDLPKEVIERNKPRAVLAQIKRLKESTSHKTGRILYLETGTHRY